MSSNESTIMRLEEELFTEEDALRKHIKIGKWVGVVLLAAIFSVPALVIVASSSSRVTDAAVQKPNLNETTCVYIKQFDLSDSLYATMCNHGGFIFLDIRRFLNNTATIKGVHLTLAQWARLKQYSNAISESVSEARTFWKDLKTL